MMLKQMSQINAYMWEPENGADKPLSGAGTEMKTERVNTWMQIWGGGKVRLEWAPRVALT